MPDGRLTPIDRSRELLPLQKAEKLTRASLYWLPIEKFPLSKGRKTWQLEFFNRFEATLAGEFGVRPELFIDYKTMLYHEELKEEFLRTALEFRPHQGLSRRPGEKVTFPDVPTEEELLKMVDERKMPDVGDYMANYSFWLLGKAAPKQRELFLGYGALTTLYLAPDPETEAPPLEIPPGIAKHPMFEQVDVQKAHKEGFALKDGFLAKSKELFGEDLQRDPQYPGMIFMLPLLESQQFFTVENQELEKWFSLFDVYVRENTADRGLVIASKHDLDEMILGIVKQMRDEDWVYPEV